MNMSREKFLCYNREERSNKDVMSRLFGLQGMRKWPQSLKVKLVSIFIDFSENQLLLQMVENSTIHERIFSTVTENISFFVENFLNKRIESGSKGFFGLFPHVLKRRWKCIGTQCHGNSPCFAAAFDDIFQASFAFVSCILFIGSSD